MLLLLCYALAVLNFTVLIAMLPSPFAPNSSWAAPYPVLIICITTTGLWAGAAVTVTLEMMAEVAYPVSEGTTANLFYIIGNLSAVLVTALMPVIPGDTVNTTMGAILLLFGLSVLPVVEVSRRHQSALATAPED